MAEKIAAEARTSFGKGAARKLRTAGRIPAVIYGHGTDPVHISLPAHETGLIIRRANAVFDLDLIIVRTGEQVEVDVPVVLDGEPAGDAIATLDSQTVLLKVLATAIPQNVVVDVEGAEDGTQITAADLKLPEGAELAADPELLIVGISVPAADASLEDATAGEDAPAEGDVVPDES